MGDIPASILASISSFYEAQDTFIEMPVHGLRIVERVMAYCADHRSNRCLASVPSLLRKVSANTGTMTFDEVFFEHINAGKLLQSCGAKLWAESAHKSTFEMCECVPVLVKFPIKCFCTGFKRTLLWSLILG